MQELEPKCSVFVSGLQHPLEGSVDVRIDTLHVIQSNRSPQELLDNKREIVPQFESIVKPLILGELHSIHLWSNGGMADFFSTLEFMVFASNIHG